MEFKDYYKVLGVTPKSSTKEIKETYRRLARKYHPDVNPGDVGAENRFKEINEAYEALRDEKKRARYDQVRAAHQSGRSWQTHARTGAGDGFPFDLGGLGGIDFDRFGRGNVGPGGFSDFFESLFGRAQRSGDQLGRDLEQEIEVTLAEAYAGTNRTFNLQVPVQCPMCSGLGRTENMVCTECRGSGTRMRQRRLDVKIPAGVREGSRIRVAGEGHPGKNGVRGNLYLIVKIAVDPRFELKSDDLHVNVQVDLVDAVLGAEVKVPMPDGNSVVMRIPVETQNGQVFRLAGQGMPRLKSGERGSLYVRVQVRLPKGLTPREKELFAELAQLRKGSPVTA
ncbi:MAG: DnaJ domain-containing protein [Chloroflexi bacterium]|nr:DnaJ domain-containing protein [Chloroflexota bacterium]